MLKIQKLPIVGYENVFTAEDPACDFLSIIAIHNTALGPAVGGTRYFDYPSFEHALMDVLRLAKGMTYKSSLAGIDFGGGKSVIIGDPHFKTEEKLKAFGAFVEHLNGQYKCAEDVNTIVDDMEIIRTITPHVLGLKNTSGDPSPLTALGVFSCIEEMAKHHFNKPLNQMHVAIQGVGHVGEALAFQLHEAGAKLTLTDINKEKREALANQLGAQAVRKNEIHKTKCDIFSPCAMGGFLNSKTIPELNCKAVIGSANNQLNQEHEDAKRLHERGILYAPDYLVNAGGIINVFIEQQGAYDKPLAESKAKAIGQTLLKVLKTAEKEDILPIAAAAQLAEQRFKA